VIDQLNAALHQRYRIERAIGTGGMATVYLADDVRHDRRVAVKVLRPELAALMGAERFLSEIRTTARLQHPHILPLFDSGAVPAWHAQSVPRAERGDGEGPSFLYYVMPYIQGDTLRDRLDREKQLPIDEALRIASEVADALHYAHRHGVIHRDVKPANILLHDTRALVADFGIALAVSEAGGGRITETGLSLGTPHYMSPEQAAGERQLDARTDVYALGCVLYEMLSGEPPHIGPNAQAVLARVLTAEPRPVTELRKTVPPHVAAALTKALQKLPADRFATAEAFSQALHDPAAMPPHPFAVATAAHEHNSPGGERGVWVRRVSIALNVVLGLAVAALGIRALGNREDDGPPPSPWVTRMRLEIDAALLRGPPQLSPDGRLIAWAAGDAIHVRSLDQIDDRIVPGTEGGQRPFFSPDGRTLGFYRGRQIRAAPLAGGPERVIADSAGLQAVWSDDGWVYFSRPELGGGARGLRRRAGVRIMRVREEGGPSEEVLAPDSVTVFQPTAVLPGNGSILGTSLERGTGGPFGPGTPDADRVRMAVLDIKARTVSLLATGRGPQYEQHTRHLVFVRGTALMAVSYDPDRRATRGDPFTVATNVGDFGLSREGTLWAVHGAIGRAIPVLLDRRGQAREIIPDLTDREEFQNAFFSPDGQRLAMELKAEGADSTDLWVYQLPAGPRTRLTYEGSDFPAWTLDGQFVLFTRADGVYRVRADGSAPPERVLRATGIGWLQPTPGGGIVFERVNGHSHDVGTASLRPGDDVRMLVQGAADEEDPAVSPDGRWLAYESNETGQPEVYVMPFGRPGRGRRISVAGGNNPLWSRAGDRLFFVNNRGGFEALRFRAAADFEVIERTTLFESRPYTGRFHPGPGDSVFLAKREGGPSANARLTLVRNWARELAARAQEAKRPAVRPE